MGAGFDLRKLHFVRLAREGVSKVLESDNTYRAIAIHDDRMSEAVPRFEHLKYAADLTLFAMAAFGRARARRTSTSRCACTFVLMGKRSSGGALQARTVNRFGVGGAPCRMRGFARVRPPPAKGHGRPSKRACASAMASCSPRRAAASARSRRCMRCTTARCPQ